MRFNHFTAGNRELPIGAGAHFAPFIHLEGVRTMSDDSTAARLATGHELNGSTRNIQAMNRLIPADASGESDGSGDGSDNPQGFFDPEGEALGEQFAVTRNAFDEAKAEHDKAVEDRDALALKVDATGREIANHESKIQRAKTRIHDCLDRPPMIPAKVHTFGALGLGIFEGSVKWSRLYEAGMTPEGALLLTILLVVVGIVTATLAGETATHIIASKMQADKEDVIKLWLLGGVIAVAFIVLIAMTTPPIAIAGGLLPQVVSALQTVALYAMLITFTGILSVMATDTSQERRIARQQIKAANWDIKKQTRGHNKNCTDLESAAETLKKAQTLLAKKRTDLRTTVSNGILYENRTGRDLGLRLSTIDVEAL